MTGTFPSKGIMYIATGKRYVTEAILSARSARRAMPATLITLLTDLPINDPAFDQVQTIPDPSFSLADKVRNMGRSPYDRTLYLDADTYVCGDLSELFVLLERFDLLVAHDALRINTGVVRLPNVFPEMNSGLIAFDKRRTERLFTEWARSYESELLKRGAVSDQYTFRTALYDSSVRFYILPPEYHCMLWEASYVCGEVKLLHGRHDIPLEKLAGDVNLDRGPRVFKAGLGCHSVNYSLQVVAWAFAVILKLPLKVVQKARTTWRGRSARRLLDNQQAPQRTSRLCR
jgi:hypothetical protein